eukprot:1315911-Alexandrium_andersonii.AAC.1
MSASLVGSEMCIRDRISCSTPRQHVSNQLDACCKRGGGGAPRGIAAEDPVSYTHLTLPTICSV